MTALDAARDLHRRGMAVIPIPHMDKKPGYVAWQQTRFAEADLPAHFNGKPQNIGVLLGEPSNWIVDVDLDHPRCVELADDYLPATPAVFGRPGNPRSHRIYRVSGPVTTAQFKNKSQCMLVELRSTGAQTVFPPSTHESGEPITWEVEGAEPALVDPEELRVAVEMLADAVKMELGEKAPPKPHPPTNSPAYPPRPPVSRANLHQRAAAYVEVAQGVSEGGRNCAALNLAGHLFSLNEPGDVRLTEPEVFAYMKRWNDRNDPPMDERELATTTGSALRNGTPREDKPSRSPGMPPDKRAAAIEAAKANTEKQQAQQRRFIVRSANTITEDLAGWAWARRVQRGGITIIFSRPGIGKTSFLVRMASHMISGQPWPDGAPCKPCDVLYVKGEGSDAILSERAAQAGIDPAHFHITGRMDDANGDAMIDMATDVPALVMELDARPNIGAIFLDTFDSLFPSVRAIDNANIRRSLWPLQELAEQRNLAVVIACHTNKGGYADPLDRLSGGRAIGAAARAVWMLGKTDPDSDMIHMASCKVNDFVPADTLAFTIRGTTPERPGAVVWSAEDCSSVSAWDLDRPRETQQRGKADACMEWMREQLASGPVPVQKLKAEADRMDFGEFVMKKCRAALEVDTRAAKGSVPPVYWYCLPGQVVPDFNDPNVTGSL